MAAGLKPAFFVPAYCAAKYGVVGFSRSIGISSIKDLVQVKCICPGATDTNFFWKGIEEIDDSDYKDQMKTQYANVDVLK